MFLDQVHEGMFRHFADSHPYYEKSVKVEIPDDGRSHIVFYANSDMRLSPGTYTGTQVSFSATPMIDIFGKRSYYVPFQYVFDMPDIQIVIEIPGMPAIVTSYSATRRIIREYIRKEVLDNILAAATQL